MDFQPGDTIKQLDFGNDNKIRGPYVVLDPVRTSRGKLRLRGPRGRIYDYMVAAARTTLRPSSNCF